MDTVGHLTLDPRGDDSAEHFFVNARQLSVVPLGVSADGGDDENNGVGFPMNKDGVELPGYIRYMMDHAGTNEILGCFDTRY